MLKSWIEHIRQNEEVYGSHYWKYQLSANVLEIFVLQPYLKNRENYRCAVIHIGRVLQALTNLMERSGCQFLIQTFPNLEDSKLIAAVRIQKKRGAEAASESGTTRADTPALLMHIMKKEAIKQQLLLEDLPGNPFPGHHSGCPAPVLKSFIITSTVDNPFIWLKTGYWLEMVYQTHQQHSDVKSPVITHFCSDDSPVSRTNSEYQNRNFIQALVSIRA